MATENPRAKARRTWSVFADRRRVPSEYEIVTQDLNWTARKQRTSALEANPASPSNQWFLTYRDRSPLKVEDWSGFIDPAEMTYRKYVSQQDEQETMVAGILEEYQKAGQDRRLTAAWRNVLLTLFTATRFPVHAAQMCHAYLGQMAPNSYITNAATFAAADQLRRVTVVAYRTRELQLAFPDEGFATQERAIWETEPDWQATRKAWELALMAYDWGECFTAVNLVLRPVLDDILLRQFGLAARANGDEQSWLLLGNLDADAKYNRAWSVALGRFAIDRRPENGAVLQHWIDRWLPRAEAAAAGLARMIERLPDTGRPADQTVAEALAAQRTVLTDIGLSPAP